MINENELAHYGVLGMKWGVRKNPDRAYKKSIKKLRSIDKKTQESNTNRAKTLAKSTKLALKSAKYAGKAQKARSAKKIGKFEKKSRDLDLKAKSIANKSAKFDYKNAKLQRKGQKWVKSMNKHFSNVKLSNVSSEDIAYGRRWAVEVADRYERKKES